MTVEDFTLDHQWLIYDALNSIAFSDGARLDLWSIYALHLGTGVIVPLVLPTPGFDIGFPALSQTSDNFLTFGAVSQETGQSGIFALKLDTAADPSLVAIVDRNFGVPSYTGDDTAIIYSQTDNTVPTGVSLVRQALAGDRLTPQGSPAVWLGDADFGTIYRRPALPGVLENPQPGSFQSGIGVLSGWVCAASGVEIEFDGGATFEAAYGTSRQDTQGVCGDANNGFSLLFNWNLLGDGVHTVRALADGVEFATVTITVTTLGLGEFPTGLSGAFTLPDFPQAGTATRIEWQQSQQNFVMVSGSASGGGSSGSGGRVLENPQPGSFQSGIGVISGFVCNATLIEIMFDGGATFEAADGTSRQDTQGVCGDANNGFSLLFNWNLLGDGVHTVRALADGVEFATATITVTTLGLGEFPTGLSGAFTLSDFPQAGTATRIEWQQSQQNFVITGVE